MFYKGQEQYESVSSEVNKLPQKENIHLVPIDVPFPFGIKKLFRFRYEVWQIKAYFAAKKIIKENQIDLIHQVTIAAWWFTGYYYLLKKPLIWGPISGFQEIPVAMYRFLRKRDVFYEFMRSVLLKLLKLPSYSFFMNIKKADMILYVNDDTKNELTDIFEAKPLVQMNDTGVQKVIARINKKNSLSEKLNILWSGLLIPRKNFGLLLQSLQKLPEEINWELKVAGEGKMLNYWKTKTSQTKANSKIKFLGKIDYSEMSKLYEWADIFVFPSLREASGTVILEAMSHGVPVIALNLNGAKNIIDPTCGILIDITNSQQMVNDFANAIIKLYENPQLRIEMGNNARKKVEENFLWENRGKEMQKYYEEIINA